MRTDRLIRVCLIVMTILLAVMALKTTVVPGEVRAQPHYDYEVVRVSPDNAQSVLAKRTKDGWEPISLSFYVAEGTRSEGFLLLRK